jgi:hypothetical protein
MSMYTNIDLNHLLSLQTPTTLVVRSSSVPDLLGANPAGIWYSMIRPFALATWITDLGKYRFGFWSTTIQIAPKTAENGSPMVLVCGGVSPK